MAVYNREFLIPYLHDLCSLQFAKNNLKEYYRELRAEKEELEEEPCPPAFYSEEITTVGFGDIFGILFGIAGLISSMSVLATCSDDVFLLVVGVGCLLFSGGLIFFCCGLISDNKKTLAANIAANQELREEMQELEKAHLEDLARIPEVEKRIEWCASEIEKVDKLHRMDMALEDQNLYLGMIESNTRATSFFAAADYFDLP